MKEYKFGDEIKLNKNEKYIMKNNLEDAAKLRTEAYGALRRANMESNKIWNAFFKKYPEFKNYSLQFNTETERLMIADKKEK